MVVVTTVVRVSILIFVGFLNLSVFIGGGCRSGSGGVGVVLSEALCLEQNKSVFLNSLEKKIWSL